MLGFSPLGAKSLGEYAATVAPTAPTFTADLSLSGAGFALALADTASGAGFANQPATALSAAGVNQALADTLTGSTANTTTPGELTETGVRLTLSQSLTSQVD